MAACNVACAFAGCGRRYGHPDAARKHARRHHAEWVALRDQEKLPCYILMPDEDGPIAPFRSVSEGTADGVSGQWAPGHWLHKKPAKPKMPRAASTPKDLHMRALFCYEDPSGSFSRALAADDATSTVQYERTPNAFQLLVAAAIAASDNDESDGHSARETQVNSEIGTPMSYEAVKPNADSPKRMRVEPTPLSPSAPNARAHATSPTFDQDGMLTSGAQSGVASHSATGDFSSEGYGAAPTSSLHSGQRHCALTAGAM